MQKIAGFLEQHVQWLVLGLGVTWLLYVVWTYVITPPVVVEVGGATVVPGRVDEIVKEKADALDRAMKEVRRVTVPPVDDPVKKFMAAINVVPAKASVPPLAFVPPFGKLEVPGRGKPGDPPINPQNPQGPKMAQLPVAPALNDIRTRVGRSTVLLPDPAGQVDQTNAALGPVTKVDLDWVTVRYTLSKVDLAKAYADAKVPQLFSKALILQTEIVREELLPDGTWGNQTVVPPLKIAKITPMPAGANPSDQMAFADWARGNQLEVVQPAFYFSDQGDRWGVPGMEEKESNPQPENFDPNVYVDPKSDIGKLTIEQKKLVLELRRKIKAEEAERRRQQGNPGRAPRGGPGEPGGEGGGGRGGEGRGGGRGPGAGGDSDKPFQAREGAFPVPGRGGMFPGNSEGFPSEGMNPQAQVGQINLSAEFPIPAGEFDPRDPAIKDITGWLHDATVLPGRTYRYMVRYKMKNPVWRTINVVEKAELANQFAIVFAGTEWTSPVTIPSLTSFFLAAGFNSDSARTVRFEIFKFQSGKLHKQSFTVAPGDAIGKTDKAVEFATGWSVVDLRKDMKSNADYVLITDSTGRLEQRIFNTDQGNAEFKKLNQQFTEQTASAAAGG